MSDTLRFHPDGRQMSEEECAEADALEASKSIQRRGPHYVARTDQEYRQLAKEGLDFAIAKCIEGISHMDVSNRHELKVILSIAEFLRDTGIGRPGTAAVGMKDVAEKSDEELLKYVEQNLHYLKRSK